jgi:hypothetical protein
MRFREIRPREFLGATQLVEQIPTEVKAAIYGATSCKIVGDVSHSDAQILTREMRTDGGFIQSLKSAAGSHAEWAFYVSGMTDRAVRVRVPYGRLESMPETDRATRVAVETIPERPRPAAKEPAPAASQPPDDWRS